MKARFVGILMLVTVHIFGQKPPIKFGDIPMSDLKMTVYPEDSSAAAVVLVDFAESTVVYNQGIGFQLNFERTRRVKILTKEGLEWADFKIPLFHDNGLDEKISGLKAITYNLENGKILETKVNSNAIISEKYDANLSYTKITWPNVKVGSVLEISYRVISGFLFNFQDWEFQSTIPVAWSEYRAYIPEYFNYSKYMQGYIPLSVTETSSVNKSITLSSIERGDGMVTTSTVNSDKIDYQENRFRWAAKDVPAFKEEPFMTTYRDYISKLNFELSYTKFPNSPIKNYMGSWEDINNSYWKSIGDEISGNNSLKKNVEEMTSGKTNPEEKIEAIYSFVNNNILWNGSYRKYPEVSMKKVFDEKKGSSAEVNLLLACLLEKAGFNVFPVLVSTRDHGFVREAIPVSSQFNNLVCLIKLDQKSILLDATDRFLPVGILPENCLNGNGLMVSKEGFQWINLQPQTKTRTVISYDLTLSKDVALKGKLKIDRSGYHGMKSRKSFLTKGEAEYIKEFVGARPWELSKSEFQNQKEIQQQFKEAYDVTVNEHIESAGDKLYFNPFLLMKDDSNPLRKEKRDYPVDFGTPFDKMYIIKITIPDGYVVEELPKSRLIALPNSAKYTYNISQLGNTISLTSNFSMTKSLFNQDEYPNLREFYNQIIAKEAEQIVLKKM